MNKMLNTIDAMNPYMVGFKLFNKQNSSKLIDKYQVSKICSAIEFRSLWLDFGRQSGKTRFALHLLEKYQGKVIIITPLHVMRDHIYKSFKCEVKHREDPRIISSHTVEHLARVDAFNSPMSHAYDVAYLMSNADYVIIDEPSRMKTEHLDKIYDIAKDTAKFIHLGNPRR